ncbi:MAG: nicotinate phosphoribosyltransferase [Methanococcaceae archaeon]
MLQKFDQNISEGILFTDQYQLVMAQLYFTLGLHEKRVQFNHFFRNYPDYGVHQAGYCINAGLEWFIDWLQNAAFGDKEIEYLRNHQNSAGGKMFREDFLKWLRSNGNFSELNLRAIPEGRVVHPHEPLTIVEGPLAIAQILETPLLNQLNFQTLIATKAARMKEMIKNRPLLEFGARRAQDRAAIAGVRAAIIGGADFSSNVGISYLLGIPPKGTHAHSLVQLFISLGFSEYEAFQAFADLYPDDTILLVDTINTLESGLPNAIRVFEKLRLKGHKPAGVRLDSGDLAYLSVMSAKMLNQAGFEDVPIVLSNDLDELTIWQIITQIISEAPKAGLEAEKIVGRLVYGVGTRLITSAGDSALGGVYKLVAVENDHSWQPAIKLSEIAEKNSLPGDKQVWRIYNRQKMAVDDLITLTGESPSENDPVTLHHPFKTDISRQLDLSSCTEFEPLLADIVKEGKLIYNMPALEDIKKTKERDMQTLAAGIKRLIKPHIYHVSISEKLWVAKQSLISQLKK